jgi:hypothetical protein
MEDAQHPDNACETAYTGRDWDELIRSLATFTVQTLPHQVAVLLRIY